MNALIEELKAVQLAVNGALELPEEPNYLRLRNGFEVDGDGNEQPTYGQYVIRSVHDALRAVAERAISELAEVTERMNNISDDAEMELKKVYTRAETAERELAAIRNCVRIDQHGDFCIMLDDPHQDEYMKLKWDVALAASEKERP